MARADRRSVRSARSACCSRREPSRDSDLAAIEDTMFFTRLRSHAKWMFVFLALVVRCRLRRSSASARTRARSIGDLLRDGGGATDGNVSVSDAREQVKKNPKSAQAQRNLATALQEDGADRRGDRRAEPLPGRSAPKDQEALRELAGLHLGRANPLAQRRSWPSCAPAISPSAPRSARRSTSARARRSARTRSTRRSRPRRTKRSTTAYTAAQTAYQKRGGGVRAARRRRAEGSEHPARAGPGGAAERRRRQGDLCVRGVPEARPGRPERADRQAADRAAEGRAGPAAVGLDSPATGKTTAILSARSAGAHIR